MIPLGVLASANVPAAGGGGVLTLTHTAATATRTEGVWRFTSVNLGSAVADRYVVVHAAGRDSAITAATIGGVSAAQLVAGASQGNYGSLWGLVVASGASATIDLTQPTGSRANIGVYTLTGYGSLSVADSDSAAAPDTFTQIADLTLTGMSAGDIVIAGSCHFGVTNATRCTWGNVTEDYDGVFTAGQLLVSSGGTSIAAGSSLTISTTWDSPRLAGPTVAVALRPA